MSFDPDLSAWLSIHEAAVRRLRRVERAAELLVAGSQGLWQRSIARGFIYVPLTDRPWIRWDAAPGQRLRLS